VPVGDDIDGRREAGRETDRFDNVLCHHININEDADAALADAKRYLDLYYGANYTKERLQAWLAMGRRGLHRATAALCRQRLQSHHIPAGDDG